MSRIDAALHDLRSLDALAGRATPLAHVDARALVLTTLAFILTVVSFDRYEVTALLPLALYPVVLAALGAVPAAALLRKLAIAAPFAVMVGLFNPLLDRTPMAVGGIDVAAGWISFASILLRFVLTVSAALLLVAGTGMNGLCAALSRLGLPKVFTAQLMFLFRYAFVLGGEAARMTMARRLRSNGRPMPLVETGPMLGHLLLRTFDRAQRIHWAMRTRGYDGEVHPLSGLKWRAGDTVFVAGWCAWFALVRSVDMPLWLGTAITGAA